MSGKKIPKAIRTSLLKLDDIGLTEQRSLDIN